MAQKVKINGKEYSCSKEVADHINWLEIQVETAKEMTELAREQLDKFQTEMYVQFEVLDNFIKQIKPYGK